MTINCNLTESDYKALPRYVMFRYRKLHWFFAVLVISVLALVWFSDKREASLIEKIAGLVGVLVAWCLLMLVFAVFWKLVTRFTGGSFRGSLGPHPFDIGEETFGETNAQGRQEVRLAGLKRVAETNSHFFVITNTGRGYVIPKRDLQIFEALYELQKRPPGSSA